MFSTFLLFYYFYFCVFMFNSYTSLYSYSYQDLEHHFKVSKLKLVGMVTALMVQKLPLSFIITKKERKRKKKQKKRKEEQKRKNIKRER